MKGNQDGSPVRYFSASSLLLFLLLFAFSPEQFGSDAAKLPDDEVSALKVTLNKLGKKDWNFSIDPCSETKGGWNTPVDSLKQNNVTCNCPYANGTVCHAVSIKLKRQNLTGVLPGEMSKLTYLTELDLSPNYLSGTIPTSWASLPLTMLVLSGNHINGKIPKEIGNIKGWGLKQTNLMDHFL